MQPLFREDPQSRRRLTLLVWTINGAMALGALASIAYFLLR